VAVGWLAVGWLAVKAAAPHDLDGWFAVCPLGGQQRRRLLLLGRLSFFLLCFAAVALEPEVRDGVVAAAWASAQGEPGTPKAASSDGARGSRGVGRILRRPGRRRGALVSIVLI
jgi:hypothetical protein